MILIKSSLSWVELEFMVGALLIQTKFESKMRLPSKKSTTLTLLAMEFSLVK